MPDSVFGEGQYVADFLPMAEVRERERLAWLAGFVDGEGYVGLVAYRNHGLPRARALCLQPSLYVANTNRPSVERAREIMGVSYAIYAKPPKPRQKTLYQIRVRNQTVVAATLTRILPYLQIKRPQAEIVLAYCQRRLAVTGMGRYAPYTPADREAYTALRVLNKRGS